jgi:anthranilate phosphoribosyltransferase
MISRLPEFSEKFRRNLCIDEAAAESLLDALINETDENAIADCFRAWDNKGIESSEIAAISAVMRSRMLRVNAPSGLQLADIVGTGGSRLKTFNVSTAAAIVAAAAGVSMAKHGNRAATSKSGSIDVLEHLGINIPTTPSDAEEKLKAHSIVFLAAPYFHRLSPTLAKVRKSLGFPTIFNCVGPLCNPASPQFQVIGARNLSTAEKIAKALFLLGAQRCWVVNSADSYDEISFCEPTDVFEVTTTGIKHFEITPADFGVIDNNDNNGFLPAVSGPAESAKIIEAALCEDNTTEQSIEAAKQMILVNAAAVIFITGKTSSLRSSYSLAENTIHSGAAKKKLLEITAREEI